MGFSRRRFIECTCKSVAGLGMASAFRRFGLMSAYAQNVTDYKALVCVFLFGGNDGNNLVVPMDTPGYTAYSNLRGGTGGLALPGNGAGSLLPITLANAQPAYGSNLFGLHPSMPEMQTLFGSGKAAVMANVGTLVLPTTRAQYLSANWQKPGNLFSHSDQQNEWQTSGKTSAGSIGWGGRIADVMQYANAGAQYPMVVSAAGAAIYTNGNQTTPVNVLASPGQPQQGVNCTTGNSNSEASTGNCNNRTAAVQNLLTMDSGISLVQAASQTTSNAFLYTTLLNNARSGVAALATAGEFTGGLGPQLRQVAEIIQVRQTLGVKRQIFFVALGGFDTHTGQGTTSGVQATLLAQVSAGMKAFYDATVELGVQDSVTTFTLSDFSRALQPNTGGGSDHAWGNHQLIMGGAVRGGDMYGQFPALAFSGPNDAGSNGRWIPTTSIDQYGATLASWFGVDNASLPTIFPNLPNFQQQKLGFMG